MSYVDHHWTTGEGPISNCDQCFPVLVQRWSSPVFTLLDHTESAGIQKLNTSTTFPWWWYWKMEVDQTPLLLNPNRTDRETKWGAPEAFTRIRQSYRPQRETQDYLSPFRVWCELLNWGEWNPPPDLRGNWEILIAHLPVWTWRSSHSIHEGHSQWSKGEPQQSSWTMHQMLQQEETLKQHPGFRGKFFYIIRHW